MLDFDGVIVKFTGFNKKMRPAVPSNEAVDCLNKLVKKTHAAVVVTSDWRAKSTVPKLQKCMNDWGCQVAVVGMTKVLGDRPLEIFSWLTEAKKLFVVENYVVLDDQLMISYDILAHQVQTNPFRGLTWADAVKAMRILEVEA